MAGKKARYPTVSVRAERGRRDPEGRGYYLARWTINGVRDGQSLGYCTEEEAEAERVAIESRLRLGMTPSDATSRSATVDDLIKRYIRDLVERGCTDKHVDNDIDRLAPVGRYLGHIEARNLTTTDLGRYVARRKTDEGRISRPAPDPTKNRRGKRELKGRRIGGGRSQATPSKRTVAYEVKLLLRAFTVCKGLKYIACDPPPPPSFKAWPDDHRPARSLLEAEVAAIVATAPAELGRLVQFLAWCPRRPIAVWALRRRDCARLLDPAVPRRQRMAWFSRDKGGVNLGWSPLTEPALGALVDQLLATRPPGLAGEALRAWEAQHAGDLVWRSETGRPLTPALIWAPFKRTVAAAGLRDVQIYDLRKHGAVVVYRHTRNLQVTCEYTGHKDPRTLLRYLSAPRGEAEDVAEEIGWTVAPQGGANRAEEEV